MPPSSKPYTPYPRSSSVNWVYYDPGMLQHTGSQVIDTYPDMSRFLFLLHYVIAIHECYRQTETRTDGRTSCSWHNMQTVDCGLSDGPTEWRRATNWRNSWTNLAFNWVHFIDARCTAWERERSAHGHSWSVRTGFTLQQRQPHCKNIRIYTDILWQVFHIFNGNGSVYFCVGKLTGQWSSEACLSAL